VSYLRIRGAAIALLLGLNTFLLAGCAVTDGGYGYSTDVRIGLDYYDPWFGNYGDYGGWGPGYRVGPPRQIMPRPDLDRGRPPHPGGFRPAPGAHPVPTIPSRPHPHGPRQRR
jgi:hypothetical protein